MRVLKNAGNDIHLVVVREREDLEKRTVVKSSRENLMITDDADEIDQALEEAFTKQEVNEVHKEPEIETTQGEDQNFNSPCCFYNSFEGKL